MCYWREGVYDNMEWEIHSINETKELTHGPVESDGFDYFLFVSLYPDGDSNMALIESPIYEDTSVSCTVSYDYYIAGNFNESLITVSLRQDDIDIPIDFLHADSENTTHFRQRVTTIGRKPEDVQLVLSTLEEVDFDARFDNYLVFSSFAKNN